jgi:tetratricopeptide (TPR) repeat protein
VELASDTAVAQADWPAAAAALQEFVTRVPNHIPALMRLVEICVDGGLEATMFAAQAQLADAYIEAGAAVEARFIAEDLVAREPWERSNIERFRRALVLLGEPDPDARIAERLSGETPFMTTDLRSSGEQLFDDPPLDPEAEAAAAAAAEAAERALLAEAAVADDPPAKRPKRKPAPRRKEDSHHFQLSANAIDLDSILGEMETPEPPSVTAHAASEDVEVDLSIVLDDIKPGASSPAGAAAAPAPAQDATPADLDGVFGNLREQASKRAGVDEAEKDYTRGLALRDAGDLDGCIQALQAASRSPKLRFVTAALAGRVLLEQGKTPEALEWMERAAQAPAPTAAEGHALLYDLAALLEQQGEVARALAMSLGLQADAGSYRDIAARIDRLTKAQARG